MLNIIRASITSEEAFKISFRDLHSSSYNGLWKTLLQLGRLKDALCAAEEGRAQALVEGLKTQYGLGEISSVSLDTKETISFISDTLPTTVFSAHQHSAVSFWIISEGRKVEYRQNAVQCRQVNEDSITVLLKSTFMNMGVGVYGRVLCENRGLDDDGDNDNDNNDENNEGDGDIQREGGGDNGDDDGDDDHDNDHGNDDNDKDNDEGDGNRGGDGDNTDIDNQDHDDDDGDDEKAEPLQCTNKLLQLVYDAIIGPIADLCQVDKLIIVPDGPLCSVPFSALSESIVIRTVLSLTSLKLITDFPADYDNVKGALLVGDPYLGDVRRPRYKQLPCAKKEVEMIADILKILPLTGKDATKSMVLKQMSSVALVHIAAHGRKETGEIALAPNPGWEKDEDRKSRSKPKMRRPKEED